MSQRKDSRRSWFECFFRRISPRRIQTRKSCFQQWLYVCVLGQHFWGQEEDCNLGCFVVSIRFNCFFMFFWMFLFSRCSRCLTYANTYLCLWKLGNGQGWFCRRTGRRASAAVAGQITLLVPIFAPRQVVECVVRLMSEILHQLTDVDSHSTFWFVGFSTYEWRVSEEVAEWYWWKVTNSIQICWLSSSRQSRMSQLQSYCLNFQIRKNTIAAFSRLMLIPADWCAFRPLNSSCPSWFLLFLSWWSWSSPQPSLSSCCCCCGGGGGRFPVTRPPSLGPENISGFGAEVPIVASDLRDPGNSGCGFLGCFRSLSHPMPSLWLSRWPYGIYEYPSNFYARTPRRLQSPNSASLGFEKKTGGSSNERYDVAFPSRSLATSPLHCTPGSRGTGMKSGRSV